MEGYTARSGFACAAPNTSVGAQLAGGPQAQTPLKYDAGLALPKVGLPVSPPHGRHARSMEPSLRVIRQLSKRGGQPTAREYDEVAASRGVILSKTLVMHFGWRWGNVLEVCERTPVRRPGQSTSGGTALTPRWTPTNHLRA